MVKNTSVWKNRSVSVLTHGVRQNTMEWAGRHSTFAILNDASLSFIRVSNRDLYDKPDLFSDEPSDQSLSTEAAEKARQNLVEEIQERKGDVSSTNSFLFADVSTKINESKVNIHNGLDCVEAIGFQSYADENIENIDEYLEEINTALSDDSKTFDLHMDFVNRLMEACIARTLVNQFKKQGVPIVALNQSRDAFVELEITDKHIQFLQEIAKKIENQPGFQSILHTTENDLMIDPVKAFVKTNETFNSIVVNKEIPLTLNISGLYQSVKGLLFGQPNSPAAASENLSQENTSSHTL
ncbi:MAG: hypothetical protein SFW66_04335 [Gammaproteobacteria bacterium]|nr:hypothetical protein [Gammaproteobacteria bacterium]